MIQVLELLNRGFNIDIIFVLNVTVKVNNMHKEMTISWDLRIIRRTWIWYKCKHSKKDEKCLWVDSQINTIEETGTLTDGPMESTQLKQNEIKSEKKKQSYGKCILNGVIKFETWEEKKNKYEDIMFGIYKNY